MEITKYCGNSGDDSSFGGRRRPNIDRDRSEQLFGSDETILTKRYLGVER